MPTANYPSSIHLPRDITHHKTVLDYLIQRFPRISAADWQQRMQDGKVHWEDGSLITADTACRPQQRVLYYREVAEEPTIPFKEQILYQDEHILVADKPHFLPVGPSGPYVNECLQHRLRQTTGNSELQTLHRLDRVTAGLVLCSVNPDSRARYQQLFQDRSIHKTYNAIARVNPAQSIKGQHWEIHNRIAKTELGFRMQIAPGQANSHSRIYCLAQQQDKALFELHPITGKRHQLRLHMQSIERPILHDRYYPELQARSDDDYARPLQLLATGLAFKDPVSGQQHQFHSQLTLTEDFRP